MPKPIFNISESVSCMIRVNHAGEYGAMRIYQGQLDATKDAESKALISHMKDQEQRHLNFFEDEIKKRGIRPTPFLPIWHYASYMLGFTTAFMGKKTAMLCTQAVEEVIDEHYARQLKELKYNAVEADLFSKIEEFRKEELEHKETSIEHGSMAAPFYILGRNIIGALCKFAIVVSKR